MVMGPNGVVHGVGTYGTFMLTPDGDGMTAVMLSHRQRDEWTATPDPTTSGQSAAAPRVKAVNWTGAYVVTGSLMVAVCGGVGVVNTAT